MKVFNRVFGLLVAMSLLAACVLTVIEVVAAQVGSRPVAVRWPTWVSWWARHDWADARGPLICVALACAATLVLQLWPRRAHDLTVHTGGRTVLTVHRRSLERRLADTVLSVNGTTTAKAKLRGRRLHIRAATSGRAASDQRADIARLIEAELSRLGIDDPPSVRVHLDGR